MLNQYLIRLFLPFVFFLFCAGCLKNEVREYKQTKLAIGTYVSISCISDQGFDTNVMIDSAFSHVDRLESLLSRHLPESPVYQFNQENLESFKLEAELRDVCFQALKIAKLSKGAFDPTVLPLINLWKDAARQNNLPTKENISAVLKNVGYEKLILEGTTLSKSNVQVKVDLGGIAKGYIVDHLAGFLKDSKGLSNLMVDAGGDIYCAGKNINGDPWRVGIAHPLDKNKIIDIVHLQDMAIATSGNYERFSIIGGKHYSHIIDPRSGWTVDDIVSVTIIAPNCVLADGLATAVTVLGMDKGLALIEEIDKVEGMIVDLRDGKINVVCSSGFKKYII